MADCKENCKKGDTKLKITVVIPVYNAENYLIRAIDSVLSQPQVDELILVEDGSSDSSKEICMKAAATNGIVELLYHPGNVNKGVSASRNLGIKNAKNELIAFLDADDYYLPGRFRKTMEIFKADTNVDGVYEMIGYHTETEVFAPFSAIGIVEWDLLFENMEPIGSEVWFHLDGLTVKRSIFNKTGLFDDTLKTSEDTLQSLKFAALAKLVPGEINKPVSLSESNVDSLGHSNPDIVKKDFIMMLLKLFQWAANKNLSPGRKELVLERLIYFSSLLPYSQYYGGQKKLSLFLTVFISDPTYLILKSSAFRRYLGILTGYNKFLQSTRL